MPSTSSALARLATIAAVTLPPEKSAESASVTVALLPASRRTADAPSVNDTASPERFPTVGAALGATMASDTPTELLVTPMSSPDQFATLAILASHVARSAAVVGPVYCTLSCWAPPPGNPTAFTPLVSAFWLPLPLGNIESRRVAPIDVFQLLASTVPAELFKPKRKRGGSTAST